MSDTDHPKLLKSKMFWVGVLYFAEGFPLGVFYDVFPVHFRQQGVELWKIGFMSLLGLAWTLKFLWAPAVDHYRHHRRWMFFSEILMGLILVLFSLYATFGAWVWFGIGIFTILSATNDVAIDGYTIEMLSKREMGLANGLRIGFYRVGMLAAGFILILSDYIGWQGTYLSGALLLAVAGTVILLYAPAEQHFVRVKSIKLREELKSLAQHPLALGTIVLFLLGVLWLVDSKTRLAENIHYFWEISFLLSLIIFSLSIFFHSKNKADDASKETDITKGPMFGTLLDMLQRPYIIPVIVFILIFKLGDASMGFMVKPFWVDTGFSASQIGFVSVNLGLILSIAGGVIGGWFTDRMGIFRALWILGLFQAFSNLGYAWVANVLPVGSVVQGSGGILWDQKILMYGASAVESFTGGLGTAAFLAFLMAIVNKQHSATEYALLSSIFALSRSLAGWASGFGAQFMGYSPYFLLTFFLSFPAYLFLPWASKMLKYAESRIDWHQE